MVVWIVFWVIEDVALEEYFSSPDYLAQEFVILWDSYLFAVDEWAMSYDCPYFLGL